MSSRGEVQQVHSRCRVRFRRDACQAATDTALTWLVLLTLDTSNSTGFAGVGDATSTWGDVGAPSFFCGIVLVVRFVSLLEIGASKGFAAYLAGKAPAKGMCLYMSLEVLGPGVSAATIAASIEGGTSMTSIWRRCRGCRLGLRRGGRSRGWRKGTGRMGENSN